MTEVLSPPLYNTLHTIQYRLLSEALVLTGADICSAVKPWDVQYPTAMDIFSEYHDQVIHLISHLVSQKKLPFFGSTNFFFFGSDRSPRCQDVMCACICTNVLVGHYTQEGGLTYSIFCAGLVITENI